MVVLIMQICSIKPLVKYADTVLKRLKMVFGKTLVNGVVKRTFFLHFCGGELTSSVLPPPASSPALGRKIR